MNLLPNDITTILGSKSQINVPDSITDTVAIDSRSLEIGSRTLFFALIGSRQDAHEFISDLIATGVENFVVNRIPTALDQKANFYLVEDTLSAFQKFAANHRSKFSFPVIGITGSNGKTIVKEWLNYLLSPEYNIVRSPKSYNSQVGVPLSILGINQLHNLGIFEAGISTVNEMSKLEPIILPKIGILTNIRSAHDEGFSDQKEKLREKLAFFKNSEVLICEESQDVREFTPSGLKLFTWSTTNTSADVRVEIDTESDASILRFHQRNADFRATIPFTDSASIENAISCVMLMLELAYNPEKIISRIADIFPVNMRLVVKKGINNTTIIDDSYSSDIQSLKIALDFLESQENQGKKKTVILSDIAQSGLTDGDLYNQVTNILSLNNINRLIGIGQTISNFDFKTFDFETYPSTDDFLNSINRNSFGNEIILIKGQRNFRFEKIVSRLEEKTHETVLEINLTALTHNLSYFKSKLKSQTKLMVMIKAFGYGAGGVEIARLLQYNNVDYLGVAFADEGITMRNSGISVPIMVLNPENTSFNAIINYNLEPEIYSFSGLQAFINIASEKGVENYPIHLKIDTGMHRLGFDYADLPKLISILRSTNIVEVRSILSHLATSDDPDSSDFARLQIQKFEAATSLLMGELSISPIRHILNTSGISNFPESQYEMVRLGIGFYGVSNDPTEQKYLERIGTLKSIISQLRHIPAGDSVGYGRMFVANRNTTIATIPIGYADGIPRRWGNKLGYVTINGKKAPIVGNVCMDMLMADCTDIECQEGDQVIIFGESPNIIDMADKLGTIPYEIMTGISQRVKRYFYRE